MSEFYQGVFIGAFGGLLWAFITDMAQLWLSNRRLNAEWEARHKKEMEELVHKVLMRGGIG